MSIDLYADSDLSAIILWEYDKTLTVEYLINNDIETILKTNNPGLIFYLDDLKGFDSYKQEFIVKDTQWFYEFNKKFSDILSDNTYGKYFFSIVVHGDIILTGLNRISCITASMLLLDDLDLPYLVSTENYNLKLTTDYIEGMKGSIEQYEKDQILYRKAFEDYFKSKK